MVTRRCKRAGMLAVPALLAALPTAAMAQAATADLIPTATARAVVGRTIHLVETQAVYPREQEAYAAAKARLLAALDGAGEQVDRPALFAHVTALLQTLDADGHAMIFPPALDRHFKRSFSVARTAQRMPSFALVPTAHGLVLRWTPPQSYGDLQTEGPLYLQRFAADYAALPDAIRSCALVVDLGVQYGGNAWPVLMAMHPLLSQANRAVFVRRDGARVPMFEAQQLPAMYGSHGGPPVHPLARFSGMQVGVIVDGKTSSAGEMLLVALLGEGERTRTFGHVSQGSTTANAAYTLPDGSLLALTTARYAIGDAAPIRGGIAPQVPAAAGASHEDTVRQAAEWAARSSPTCRGQGAEPVERM